MVQLSATAFMIHVPGTENECGSRGRKDAVRSFSLP